MWRTKTHGIGRIGLEKHWVDYKNVETLQKFFIVIIELDKYPSLSLVTVAFNQLVDYVEKVCAELDTQEKRSENDEKIILALEKGKAKILRHYSCCNWVYGVPLILDPRHKLQGKTNADGNPG